MSIKTSVITIVMGFVGAFLGAYIKRKGENVATKEDIGEITTVVEESKSFYTKELEHLKNDLAMKRHFSGVRYEHEIEIYEMLWSELCKLAEAVLSLRPAFDSSLKLGETEDARKQERLQKFYDAFQSLRIVVLHNRPFYPETIWNDVRDLFHLCNSETVSYQYGKSDGKDWYNYWNEGTENSKKIETQVNKICEAIRFRLAKFDQA